MTHFFSFLRCIPNSVFFGCLYENRKGICGAVNRRMNNIQIYLLSNSTFFIASFNSTQNDYFGVFCTSWRIIKGFSKLSVLVQWIQAITFRVDKYIYKEANYCLNNKNLAIASSWSSIFSSLYMLSQWKLKNIHSLLKIYR